MELIIVAAIVLIAATGHGAVRYIRLPSAGDRVVHRYGQHAKLGVVLLLTIAVISLAASPLFCHFGIGQFGALHCHALPEWLKHVH